MREARTAIENDTWAVFRDDVLAVKEEATAP
jgi:hypothetical protein